MGNSMPLISRVQKNKQALPGPLRLSPEGSLASWWDMLLLSTGRYSAPLQAWGQHVPMRPDVQLSPSVSTTAAYLSVTHPYQHAVPGPIRPDSEPLHRRRRGRPCAVHVHRGVQRVVAHRVARARVHLAVEHGGARVR